MRTRENPIKGKRAAILLVFVVMLFLVLAFFPSPIFFQEGNALPVLRALAAVEFLNRDLARIDGLVIKYLQKDGPAAPLTDYLAGHGWVFKDQLGSAIFYERNGQTLSVKARKLTRFYTVYELDQEPGISYAGVQPEIMIMGPDLQTYDLDATRWEFPLVLTIFGAGNGTAAIVEFSIDGHNLLQLIPEAQRTLPVHRLDNEIDRESFRKWLAYLRRIAVLRVRNDEQAIFSAAEEKDFRELMERVLRISKLRDISPGMGDASYLVVSVASLPFRVAADGHYKVKFAVEQGRLRAGWVGEILIVDVEPLVTSLVWTPPGRLSQSKGW
ncbi:MAG: hypothetical protein KGZ57_07585 [Dethiobacter sp.]|nr:hypothetical protein [Dethiobacter sp.]